jgi:hypothetical protein
MAEMITNKNGPEERALESEERLRLGEAAGEIATFALDLASGKWDWSPRAASLFGFDSEARCPASS